MEMLQQIIDMVKGMPELAIWVLAGLLLYKIIFIGSWFGLARLLILKTHDFFANPKPKPPVEVIKKHDLGGMFITHDGTLDRFFRVVQSIRGQVTGNSEYIHKRDVAWLEDAVEEKRARDKVKQ